MKGGGQSNFLSDRQGKVCQGTNKPIKWWAPEGFPQFGVPALVGRGFDFFRFCHPFFAFQHGLPINRR